MADTKGLRVTERLPGWQGRCFDSMGMTFAHCDRNSSDEFRSTRLTSGVLPKPVIGLETTVETARSLLRLDD
jgi:hypothetical protein